MAPQPIHDPRPIRDPVLVSVIAEEAAAVAIAAHWEQLGGIGGLLGDQTGVVEPCPDGIGYFRTFANGAIYFTPETGAHEVHGAIRTLWASLGWETGLLRYPTTDETGTPDGQGRFNHFQGGSIYWTPQTGAHEVHGAIRALWGSLGWETSSLGYPVTDETSSPDAGGSGRVSTFQGGTIFWTRFQGPTRSTARSRVCSTTTGVRSRFQALPRRAVAHT